MAPRLPVELFIKILTFLPRAYLSDVSSLSHFFRDLSAPLQFSSFRFHPGVQVETCASGTRFRWELDRLAFWSSDTIAPLVRKCFISLYCTSIMIDPGESSPLGAAVFEAVSRFKNLRLLSCNLGYRPLELTGLRVAELVHLQRIEINAGRLTPPHDPPAPRLEIAHFSYTDMPNLPLYRPPCISMLDPARLCSLELSPLHPRSFEHFFGDGSPLALFHNLATLKITFRNTDFTSIHAAIAPFPAIRALIVHVDGSCRADAVPAALLAPHLDSYRGPAVLLPLVLAASAPEELAIMPQGNGGAADVLRALQTAMHPDFITSLSMGVNLYADMLESDVLQDILDLCPSLARLALEVSWDGIPVPINDGGEVFDVAAVSRSGFLRSVS
ncbi:hypothetical protein K438DRAFT_1969246 [Mycena galopus ATCC 62051]|nr:hypothetical protein K438DRAFT_1969246 [Mycena galopus ATCC 62051]